MSTLKSLREFKDEGSFLSSNENVLSLSLIGKTLVHIIFDKKKLV